MKFSIITAAKDAAAKLPRALQSLSAQSCHDLEHLIVLTPDDTPTRTIAEEYAWTAPYRVKILIQEHGKGVYDALNRGIEAAEGTLVGILHADDVYATDDVLQRVWEQYAQTGVGILYGDVVYTSGRRYSASGFVPQQLLQGFAPPHPATFIERALHDKYGVYDPTYLSAGDFDLLVRMLLKGKEKSVYIPDTLQVMDSGGRSSSWRYRLFVNMQEKRRSLHRHGYRAPWHRLLRRYLH